MLRLLLGKDWTLLRHQVLTQIAQDVHARQGGRVLMVPELISHEAERALCAYAGDTASRYAEVLSFTRLSRSVLDQLGTAPQECLDNGGRVVAMAAAARHLSGQLKAYAALESKPEFLKELVDAVDEFKRCCILPEDLKAASQSSEGAFAQKLEELALLMESYDGLCAQGKRDPRDRMTWLLEELHECDYAQTHVFYIDGFPDFTRQNMAILEHLIHYSPLVTVTLNCDCPGSELLAFEKPGQTAGELLRIAARLGIPVQTQVLPSPDSQLAQLREKLFQGSLPQGISKETLGVYRAASSWQETMAAAGEIAQLVRSGCRYRDISLVVGDMPTYSGLVGLIFRRMGIPVYQTGTEDILTKSVIATVLSAIDAVVSGFEQRSTLRYLRSAMSPLTPDECDALENYTYLWRIQGKKWLQPWESHPDGLSGEWTSTSRQQLETLNALREKAIVPLQRLHTGFEEAKMLHAQVLAVYHLLEDIGLEQRLEQLAGELEAQGDGRGAQILGQLWEILLGALEQMYDILGQTHWESEHFARLFRLLLSQYDVGTIPPVLDAVQMGTVSALRCHPCKHLFILGAKEGCLPSYSGSKGILSDQERVALRKLGVPLTGGAMEGIQEEFSEIYGVFCGASQSVRVYCSAEQPSYLYRRLAQMGTGIEDVSDGLEFAGSSPRETGVYLARWHEEAAARELNALESYHQALSRAEYTLGQLTGQGVRALYGQCLELSASQVDTQASCRLKYFLQYGLRARERKVAEVDPAEFGTYVHDVLEKTGREVVSLGGFTQVSLEQTLDIAHKYSQTYAEDRFRDMDSSRLQYLFRRNGQELDMVVQELWQELHQGLFQPVEFELSFGRDGKMPPVEIPNGAMEARIRGFVDRVDTWQDEFGKYVRVVDYKTGKKSFDYCDITQGLGLQMLLYLFALEQSGQVIPAGVEYFPARAPYLSGEAPIEPEEAEKLRKKEWVRSGLFLREDRVLEAMEPGQLGCRLPVKTKDGALSGSIASREQFRLLESYIFDLLRGMVSDIASGNVEPNPYSRGSSYNVCQYCPYAAVCHPEKNAQRRNFRTLKSNEFWEEIESKEAKEHD